jgi:hypothetical protein
MPNTMGGSERMRSLGKSVGARLRDAPHGNFEVRVQQWSARAIFALFERPLAQSDDVQRRQAIGQMHLHAHVSAEIFFCCAARALACGEIRACPSFEVGDDYRWKKTGLSATSILELERRLWTGERFRDGNA